MENLLREEADALQDQLVGWRRALHQIPETGTTLPQTVKFVTSVLDELEVKYQVLEDSSNVGDPDITVAAIEEDKLVGEYMNNAVMGIWAMDKVTPVAQGGGVIVDGVATNLTFSVLKPELSRVYSAKELASGLGGCVLNVVKIKTPAELRFNVANVNFYTPGIMAGQNVKVFRFAEDTGWTEFHVSQVRQDHVVVDMTAGGILAFIEVPA